MIQDIITIMGKEFREWFHMRGSKRSGILVMVVPALVFGIMFPIQMGVQWVSSPATLAMLCWMPLLLVIALIADSIAGERERHTLETLLASRLSDSAILFGKVCAAATYAIVFSSILALISLITVNLTHWGGSLLMYPLRGLALGAVINTLLALLGSSAGVLVSMRSSSAREAQQILTFCIIGIAIFFSVIFQVLPKPLVQRFTGFLDNQDPVMLLGAFLTLVVLIDVILLTVAILKFRRSRMILD